MSVLGAQRSHYTIDHVVYPFYMARPAILFHKDVGDIPVGVGSITSTAAKYIMNMELTIKIFVADIKILGIVLGKVK